MQANVRSLQAELAKTVLRSPIAGTVTQQDAKAGETVTPGTPIVSVISKNQLQVEAYITEADIAKVKIGDIASTTLDAYGDTVDFPTVVVSIDPAETILEGVATYKTTFRFAQTDDRVKPGMTANIDILTQKKDSVPALPQRVLIHKEGGVFVDVLESDGTTVKEIPITEGLRGSDGYTEILSGLGLGQQVIVPQS
jgi:HlyD family secretion protein